jgi:uncharacterized protein
MLPGEEEIMRKTLRLINYACVLFVASCVTVNVYFPAAAVQKAADEIVGDVTQSPGPGPAPRPGPSSSLGDYLRGVSLGLKEVHAQVDINVSTPGIRAARDTMKGVWQQLKPYYQKAAVGENNNGFVDIRDTAGLNLQERNQMTNLVDQMNKARSNLYREIAVGNKLGPEAVPQVQKIFANSWRDKSQPGWWIQTDAGAWVKK